MQKKRLEDRQKIAIEKETTDEIDIKNGFKIGKQGNTMDCSTTCIGKTKEHEVLPFIYTMKPKSNGTFYGRSWMFLECSSSL